MGNINRINSVMDAFDKGTPVAKIVKDNGISIATFYNYKKKRSTQKLEVIDTTSELEQYKRLVAELTLENKLLKSVNN